ncbi:hypothetical protein KQI41_14480 [Tissierella pigra]|uniref:hypothetical protein n=1 Tax=Tissierella pigra TaxID=2607614 RepID=UPI001C0F633F|nr:hypothetical protein [Tissierella pigra]MBU5427592.1 hypothetical protein [Tissierella pigra]
MKLIITIAVSTIIFGRIFTYLRKVKPQLFLLFEKIPRKWKEKYIYRWLVLLPIFLLSSIIFTLSNAGDIVGGTILGCIISLADIAFTKL